MLVVILSTLLFALANAQSCTVQLGEASRVIWSTPEDAFPFRDCAVLTIGDGATEYYDVASNFPVFDKLETISGTFWLSDATTPASLKSNFPALLGVQELVINGLPTLETLDFLDNFNYLDQDHPYLSNMLILWYMPLLSDISALCHMVQTPFQVDGMRVAGLMSLCLPAVREFSQTLVNGGASTRDSGWGDCSVITEPICPPAVQPCDPNPCEHGGECTVAGTSFSCLCATGYEGTTCATEINECVGASCAAGSTCADQVGSFACVCAPGFQGQLCEVNIDDCTPTICQNGGSCHDGVQSVLCTCAPGYEGPRCATNIQECDSSPCAAGATCVDKVNSFACTCAPGFDGILCDHNVDECASVPCQNDGACTDLINGFSCTCAGGFSGLRCEVNIDECASNPCQNDGTCHDGINGYYCSCAYGWAGLTCASDNVCDSNPCQNGATCKMICNNGQGGGGGNGRCWDPLERRYICLCAPGFEGTLCQNDRNECLPDPCENSATCVNGANRYACICRQGFRGARCQSRGGL